MKYRFILIICLATLGLADAGWGQAGGKIAFISGRDSGREEHHHDVWIMNADGSNPVNLTKGRNCASPAWSPDGTKIAYIGDIFDDDQYGGEIWLMDADGGNPQQLTDDSVDRTRLSWSEDGSSIYYTALTTDGPRNRPSTFVLALDGSGSSFVDDWGEVPHHRRSSRSPDGTKEAVIMLRAAGDEEGHVRLFVRDASEDEFIFRPTDENPGILLPDIFQSDETVSDQTITIRPTWSPDSMRIAFSSRDGLIWAVDTDGGNLVELTNGLGGNSPAWQPAIPAATSVESQSWGRIKSLLLTDIR